MDQSLQWLREFGERCKALPYNMRAFFEPDDLGLLVWLKVLVGHHRSLHAQRIVSWEMLGTARCNPLVEALDSMLRQVEAEGEPA